jgi:hypothetical protein
MSDVEDKPEYKATGTARLLTLKYIVARQNREIMRGILADDVTDIFQNTYGAHALQALRYTLITDLVRECYAIALDNDPRSPSLCRVVSELGKYEVREILKAEYAAVKGPFAMLGESREEFNRWSALVTEDRKRKFEVVYARLVQDWERFKEGDLAKRVATARNKAVAHYEVRDEDKRYVLARSGIKWEDPELFLDEISSMIWDAVLLCTNQSYAVALYEERSQLYAKDFWTRLRSSGVPKNKEAAPKAEN